MSTRDYRRLAEIIREQNPAPLGSDDFSAALASLTAQRIADGYDALADETPTPDVQDTTTNTLDGAGEPGQTGTEASTPAQFAARWNSWDNEYRTLWLQATQEHTRRGLRCYEQAHEERIAHEHV